MASITSLSALRASLSTPSVLPQQPRIAEPTQQETKPDKVTISLCPTTALWLFDFLAKEHASRYEAVTAKGISKTKRANKNYELRQVTRCLTEINESAKDILLNANKYETI